MFRTMVSFSGFFVLHVLETFVSIIGAGYIQSCFDYEKCFSYRPEMMTRMGRSGFSIGFHPAYIAASRCVNFVEHDSSMMVGEHTRDKHFSMARRRAGNEHRRSSDSHHFFDALRSSAGLSRYPLMLLMY